MSDTPRDTQPTLTDAVNDIVETCEAITLISQLARKGVGTPEYFSPKLTALIEQLTIQVMRLDIMRRKIPK